MIDFINNLIYAVLPGGLPLFWWGYLLIAIFGGYTVATITVMGDFLLKMAIARIKKRTILFVARKDRYLDVVLASYEAGNLKTKGYDEFFVVPGTIYKLPNQLPAAIVYSEFGMSLQPEVVQGIKILKNIGYKSQEHFEKEYENKKPEEKPTKIEFKRQTVDFAVVEGFLKRITPVFITSRINNRVNQELEKYKTWFNKETIFAFMMVVMVGAIAYTIVSGGGGGAVGGAIKGTAAAVTGTQVT